MIPCGNFHTIILNDKNEVYVCGWNSEGQLGLGDNKNRNIFEKIDYDFGLIKNMFCGSCHTIILNDKNEVYVCGYNASSQSDLGDNNNRYIFEKIDYDLGKIKNIYCGNFYTIILNDKNEIYVCGSNFFGQLGLGDYDDRNKFTKVEYDFGLIKNVSCGFDHTIILNDKNEIYVCGDNSYGQLGLGNCVIINIFEKVEYDFGSIKNVYCGGSHTIILNDKNEIYVCGDNIYGQLGLGDNDDDDYRNKFEKVEYDLGLIKNICCGNLHTIILNDKNDVYVCGYNKNGQLGLGNCVIINKFEKLEYDFGLIKNISCGSEYTVILNDKNEIYVCGDNEEGQLGLGDNENRNIFTKVEYDFGFEQNYNFEFKFEFNDLIIL